MTATTHTEPSTTLLTNATRGIIGGLVGGLMFGLMMQMMDMIPMVAMLVGSESVAVGWLVHLAISAFIGATFGLLLGSRATTLLTGIGYGTAYGILWWVLGALIAMPAKLGMPVFNLDTTAQRSLLGHMVFGAILGTVVALINRRDT